MAIANATKRLGSVVAMDRPWTGIGPFIFAMHHVDHYPEGNAEQGPKPSIAGRNIGMDMNNPSGWNMYHGKKVPGFPAHPHRGFETVTIMKQGVVDHADSTGAGARYGPGDVQWVTAGRGVSHSEMFPLVNEDKTNDFELYQLWLNLPSWNKLAPPNFEMYWNEKVPVITREGPRGTARARIIAGQWDSTKPLAPPSASWAHDPVNDVAIWLIEMEPHSSIKVPAPNYDDTKRMLYVHGTGARVDISGTVVGENSGFEQEAPDTLTLTTGASPAQILVLQGKEIGEPVAQHGPFVMNTREELAVGFAEYRRTEFGGWPWGKDDPVWPRDTPRFAKFGSGKKEYPEGEASATAATKAL
jgi:redox-sensitive bicupin YhaK (pirin superfamily)